MPQKKMTSPKKAHVCPECSMKFSTIQVMSMHRANAHGVVGTSKSSLNLRKQREKEAQAPAPGISPAPLPPTDFPCSHCEKVYNSANGLAKHQSKAHGIPGTSKSARERQARKLKLSSPPAPLPEEYRCEQCGFLAKTQGGLLVHIGTRHKKKETALVPSHEETNLPTTTHRENGQPHPDGIPQATLALALGRFQGLCQSMATEFDLPQRTFASRLAQLIYHSTLR